MMLQDESQLSAKFGSNASSVIGNCYAYLLTGTTDLNMAKCAAERFNRQPQAIRQLDEEHFLLDIGGYIAEPERYDYYEHPNYVDKPFDIHKFMQNSNFEVDETLPGLTYFITDIPEVKRMKKDIYAEYQELAKKKVLARIKKHNRLRNNNRYD